MRTVVTRKIDGHEIIVGFGKLAMDPEATREIVKVEILKTAEFLAVDEKKKQYRSMIGLAEDSGTRLRHTSNADLKEKHHRDKSGFLERANGHMDELRELAGPLKEKEKTLLSKHAVYFEPKPGEHTKSEDKIGALIDLRASVNGKVLIDIDGKVVEDNRGVVHCRKLSGGWKIIEISTLGVKIPRSSILYADLDDDQKSEVDLQVEKNVVLKMLPSEKIKVRQRAEMVALRNAAGLRSRLEIQGHNDALEQSQEFYRSRMDEISVIYG